MPYYLRFRQSITGPFTLEQLRDMSRKGAITPVHLFSEDRKTWVAADRIPGLQDKKRPESRGFDTGIPSGDLSSIYQESATESASDPYVAANSDTEYWYFMHDGKRHGPVDITALLTIARSGNILGSDLVWQKETDWRAAASVPQLSAVFSSYAASGANTAPPNRPATQTAETTKSKIAAGLLALFLGLFGAHHFYLGYTAWGVFRLLLGLFGFAGVVEVNTSFNPSTLSVLWALAYGLSSIFAFIEAMLLFFGAIKQDANGVRLV